MILVCCSVFTPECSWNSHVYNNILLDGNDGGRTVEAGAVRILEAKGAIHNHNDVPRFPERRRDRACGVDVYQLKRPLSRLDG